MARDAGGCDSRSGAGHSDGCDARDCARLGRDGAVVVYGFWESIFPGVVEPADRVVDGADLQLRDLAVRRVARAGVGGDARVDDVGVGDQHHRAILDAKEILTTDLTDLQTINADSPKIEVRKLEFFYGRVQALHEISIEIPERIVMALLDHQVVASRHFSER